MSTYNKIKGTRFETDLENHLNESGLKARRLPRAGAKDIGDLSIYGLKGIDFVIEAKNHKTPNMGGWLDEAATEAGHYEDKYDIAAIGVVCTKTRGKHIADARITMTLETFINLLRWNEIA